MEWKKAGVDKSKYLKFTAGESFEGVYEGYSERTNPFYDPKNENSSKTIIDYNITIDDEQKILSSTAKTLQDQLIPLETPCQVKIDCVAKGIKKFYQVWTVEE